MPSKCLPPTDPNSNYSYCPSLPAAILFSTLFALLTTTHIALAITHRKPFAWVLCMGAAWELVGYVFRALGAANPISPAYALAQLLLILLAPLWINAFVYMVLGRAVHFFLPEGRDIVLGVRARKITAMFVCFDIVAFLVQATGGSMTSNSNPESTQRLGLHIYMGGVGLQLCFIAVFLAVAARFHRRIRAMVLEGGEPAGRGGARSLSSLLALFRRAPPGLRYRAHDKESSPDTTTQYNAPHLALPLLYATYATLALIVFRNIYRLIEFSQGVLSSITTHEWYAYVFDAVPMLLACVVLALFYPGRTLRGPRCDFEEENRVRREEKRVKKEVKEIEKREKREVKKQAKAMGKKRKGEEVMEKGNVLGQEE